MKFTPHQMLVFLASKFLPSIQKELARGIGSAKEHSRLSELACKSSDKKEFSSCQRTIGKYGLLKTYKGYK